MHQSKNTTYRNKLVLLLLILFYSCLPLKSDIKDYCKNLNDFIKSKNLSFKIEVKEKKDKLITTFISKENVEREILSYNLQLEFVFLVYTKYMKNFNYSNYEFVFYNNQKTYTHNFSSIVLKEKAIKMNDSIYARQVDTIISVFNSSEMYSIEHRYHYIDSSFFGYKPRYTFFDDYYNFIDYRCNNHNEDINNKSLLKILMLNDLLNDLVNRKIDSDYNYNIKIKLKRVMSVCNFNIDNYKIDDFAPTFFKIYRADSLQYEKY